MTLASEAQAPIIRTERGLTIAGTRIRLYDVMEHLAVGWTPNLILNWLSLTENQLNAALDYIETNRTEVEAEYQAVLEATKEMRQYCDSIGMTKIGNV